MKQLIILVCAITLLHSCKSKEKTSYDITKQDSKGTGSALVNGKSFISTKCNVVATNGRLAIGIDFYLNELNRQSIGFFNINPNKLKQVVYSSVRYVGNNHYVSIQQNDSCMASFILTDYDVIENVYEVIDNASDNLLTIESYDSSRIKGSFNITLFRTDIDTRPQTQGMPDTLRITNGKFDVSVQ